MTDIVDRLKTMVIIDNVCSDNPLGEAAAEITRLRARVAELEVLLEQCAEELEGGIETEHELEAEHSKSARKLVAAIRARMGGQHDKG